MKIEDLIEELKKIDKVLPKVNDKKFLNTTFPYTIDETIKILEKLIK